MLLNLKLLAIIKLPILAHFQKIPRSLKDKIHLKITGKELTVRCKCSCDIKSSEERLGVVLMCKVVDTITTSQASVTTLQEDSDHISTIPRQHQMFFSV